MTEKTVLLLNELTPAQKNYVMNRLAAKEKDLSVAYLCWFFCIHYFYLRKPVRNILYWITYGGFFIWAIIDLFRMKSLVEKCNETIVQKLIQEASLLEKLIVKRNKSIALIFCLICGIGSGNKAARKKYIFKTWFL